MSEYILVEAKSKEDLRRYVNEACRNGFKPCGSIIVIEYHKEMYGAPDLWIQPMFKE